MSAFGRWPPVIVLATSLFGVASVGAAERVHTVAAGESAASLAKKYYGDPDLGDLLLGYNGKPGTVIRPRERLTIPFCEVYRARPGDTWSGLAKQHLGRASASSVLAELNGSPTGQPLRVGARVVFPVVLRHTLARGESLSSLSARFYGDARRAATLQSFSRIGDAKRVPVGTPLQIPLVAFLRAETEPVRSDEPEKAAVAASDPSSAADALPEASPEVRVPPPAAEERRFEKPLAEAGRQFSNGEYDRAREMLEALLARVAGEGAVSDRREWGQLLAFVYIALDRDADACTAYRSGSPPAGPTDFDPDLISPRIRAVLSSCPAANPSVEQLDNPIPRPQIPIHAGTRG